MRLSRPLAAGLAAVLLAAGPGAGQPHPKSGGPPPDEPAAPAPPEKAAPVPQPAPAAGSPVAKKCQLPGGGVRVLTLKQKQCRQQAACTCAQSCPACP
jgi:hypothetical protein